MFYYYHWVDISAGGLFVGEGIIRPIVNASTLPLLIMYIWLIQKRVARTKLDTYDFIAFV